MRVNYVKVCKVECRCCTRVLHSVISHLYMMPQFHIRPLLAPSPSALHVRAVRIPLSFCRLTSEDTPSVIQIVHRASYPPLPRQPNSKDPLSVVQDLP